VAASLPLNRMQITQRWNILLHSRFCMEEAGLLELCAVFLGSCIPMFRQNVVRPSSGLWNRQLTDNR